MIVIMLLALVGVMPSLVSAHVKWFADFSFLDAPLGFQEALTPLFIGFVIASAIAMTATVFIDTKLEELTLYKQVREWLNSHRQQGTLILRIAMGATFLLSWQADTLLAPYLEAQAWIGWVQFIFVLLLLFPQTTPLAGAGTIALWLIGVQQFGIFYMLDYIAFVGIGTWLLLSQAKTESIRELGIPALYFTVGFALAWLSMEKIIYPQWGYEILEQVPQLTLGFPPEFFLLGAAFVEFTLGYLLIIGLLGRPLSLVITLVFFTTTLVFGKVEIIGHTHLHAALLVFLLYGPGKHYPAPIDIHRKISWRMAFAAVNYVILAFLFLGMFTIGARSTYQHAVSEMVTADDIAACENADIGTTVLINGQDVPCEIVQSIPNRE
ncbi:MAG: DoxX family membrane protein [Phototrophicaceae bacterium]